MSGYTKLFGSILHSTIWQTPGHVRLVWITMLALADRDGLVEASVPGLAVAARVTRAEVEEALASLLGPDPDSRTTDHDGRRIAPARGGWMILNHGVYQDRLGVEDRRHKGAERQRRKRERDAARPEAVVTRDVTPGNAGSQKSQKVTAAVPSGSGSDASSDVDSRSDPPSEDRPPAPVAQPGLALGPVLKRPEVVGPPGQDIVEIWNTVTSGALPGVMKLTNERRRWLRSRAQAERDHAWWRALFERVVSSAFLSGAKTSWCADFDFVVRSEQNIAKILEGSYDTREEPGRAAPRYETAAQRMAATAREGLAREAAERARPMKEISRT